MDHHDPLVNPKPSRKSVKSRFLGEKRAKFRLGTLIMAFCCSCIASGPTTSWVTLEPYLAQLGVFEPKDDVGGSTGSSGSAGIHQQHKYTANGSASDDAIHKASQTQHAVRAAESHTQTKSDSDSENSTQPGSSSQKAHTQKAPHHLRVSPQLADVQSYAMGIAMMANLPQGLAFDVLGHVGSEVGIEEFRKNLIGISREFHRNCMYF
jgi:hypothetical protein